MGENEQNPQSEETKHNSKHEGHVHFILSSKYYSGHMINPTVKINSTVKRDVK